MLNVPAQTCVRQRQRYLRRIDGGRGIVKFSPKSALSFIANSREKDKATFAVVAGCP